jgi:hypothetical protein
MLGDPSTVVALGFRKDETFEIGRGVLSRGRVLDRVRRPLDRAEDVELQAGSTG